ncbi:hypothetical protein ACFFX0_13145 [Citricoccus parietis]|uniref:Uncharacterized protein n=1 Tax=Citricoccus parietis TaxID=592307 RepID=A0ABV5FZI5_9MICC
MRVHTRPESTPSPSDAEVRAVKSNVDCWRFASVTVIVSSGQSATSRSTLARWSSTTPASSREATSTVPVPANVSEPKSRREASAPGIRMGDQSTAVSGDLQLAGSTVVPEEFVCRNRASSRVAAISVSVAETWLVNPKLAARSAAAPTAAWSARASAASVSEGSAEAVPDAGDPPSAPARPSAPSPF